MQLPIHVGPYVASVVEYGGDPLQGAFVRYVPGDSTSALPRIDVIVYPSDGGALREFLRSHDDLMEVDRDSPQVAYTTLLSERRFPLEAADDTAYRAAYYLEIRDVPQRSVVYLHRTRDHFVKARVSLLMHPGFDPEDRIDDVVSALFTVVTADR